MDVADFYKIFQKSNGISIDSRTVESGQIFVALKGDHFDGHKFVEQTLKKNAAAAIIQDASFSNIENTYLVEDSLTFLQELANYHRKQFDIPVICLTGSNGKTTTKELLNVVLSKKYRVHATKGNFNNHIGVPLSLLSAPLETELMIIELGANHIGEIAELARIAEPTHGFITNISQAHIEGFGSLEGVITAKTELYEYLKDAEGLIFYNPLDSVLSSRVPENTKVLPYVQYLTLAENSNLMLNLYDTDLDCIVNTQLYGKYNYSNLWAAITVGIHFGVDRKEMYSAISQYFPQMNRSQLVEKENVLFILDAYNANPSSMRESILSIRGLDESKSKSLILGDMNELGKNEIEFHEEVLTQISDDQWQAVLLVGEKFKLADQANRFLHYSNVEELISDISNVKNNISDTICLVKASRSIGLEKLIGLF